MSSQPVQPPPNNAGAFIFGLFAGFFIGGTFLTFFILLIMLLIAGLLQRFVHDPAIVGAVAGYACAVAAGVFAFKAVRKSVDFVSGLLVGVTAGLLGGVTICTDITSSLNNMH